MNIKDHLDLEKVIPLYRLQRYVHLHFHCQSFILVIRDMYVDASTRVWTDADLSSKFPVRVGLLHQGPAPSPFLFVIVMDVVF